MITRRKLRNLLLSVGLLLLALLLWPAGPALADGDGYYCAGRGYLAYQFNELSTAPKGHFLYLIELDPKQGFSEPRRFALDPFQVLGMRCLDDSVDLLAWDRIYRIDLKEQGNSQRSKIEPQPEDSLFPDFTSDNLGREAPTAQTIPLKTIGGRFRFELVIERQAEPSPPTLSEQTRPRVRSLLRQKNTEGTVRELEIFSNFRTGTLD